MSLFTASVNEMAYTEVSVTNTNLRGVQCGRSGSAFFLSCQMHVQQNSTYPDELVRRANPDM